MKTLSNIDRALLSLEGLSIGDAFGEKFFDLPEIIELAIEERDLPVAPWWFTDDTQMALSIVDVLHRYGTIDQATLAKHFAEHYDNTRGYGPAMHALLQNMQQSPAAWKQLASNQFGGQGSFGNGSAMRVAPVGAYFAGDMAVVVEEARKSSEVTHTHPEAIAGAIAVAVAAAIAATLPADTTPSRSHFLEMVLPHVPDSQVRDKIVKARDMDSSASVRQAVTVLGNGENISAQDTVPFSLWAAGEYLNNYEEALWQSVSGLGDRDTTCAIVGGIVVLHAGIENIAKSWRESREPLPDWFTAG